MSQDILSKVPLFSLLPKREIRNLATTLNVVTLPKGAILFREGEIGDRSYVVIDGLLEIVKALGDSSEMKVGLRGPGDHIGEMSMFQLDSARSASARVLKDCHLFEMTHADFDALIHRQPAIVYQVLKVLTTRLREANDLALSNLREKNVRLSEAYEALKNAQAQIIEKERLDRELQLAYEMQSSLIPRATPKIPGWEFSARWLPARNVSGDYYDFILHKHNQQVGLVIADVADKGMAASLFMAVTRSTVRASVTENRTPRQVIGHANDILCADADNGLFVTLFYADLNPENGELTYVNAGHNPPYYHQVATGEWQTLRRTGLPLGLLRQTPGQNAICMEPGDLLFLYTDGVTDANDLDQQEFGMERIKDVLAQHVHEPASAIAAAMEAELKKHCGGQQLFDDITFLVIKRAKT